MNKNLRGSIILILATIIWGSTFVAQDIAAKHMGPFTFQAIRCGLAVLALVPVSAFFDRFHKDGKTFLSRWAEPKLWIGGLLCGIALFLACNLQQLGIDGGTDPGKSAFLTAMYIVIVPIIGIFRKQKPSILIPVSVVLAVAGLYFLSCVGVTQISTADLLLIACAFFFAVQITFVDIYAVMVDPVRLNTVQVLVCTLLSAGVAVFTETVTWQAVGNTWLPLCYAGFLSMGAAYCMQIFGQKDLEPAGASLIMSLESVFALFFGILMTQEPVDQWKILGCGLMFLAVILSQLPIPLKKKTKKL